MILRKWQDRRTEMIAQLEDLARSSSDELTPDERREQFDTVIWFREQRDDGKLKGYEGKFVAVHGCQVVDCDANERNLAERITANEEDAVRRMAIIQYVPCPNEWLLR